jgi:hypothetical protein
MSLLANILSRLANRKRVFSFQAIMLPNELTQDEVQKLDLMGKQLISQGYPVHLVELGKKQVADFAVGIANSYGGTKQDEKADIIANAINRATMPGGMYENWVTDFYGTITQDE